MAATELGGIPCKSCISRRMWAWGGGGGVDSEGVLIIDLVGVKVIVVDQEGVSLP